MSLDTFHSDINVVIARGSSVAPRIPRWTRQANLWLEQNYSFRHMRKTHELTLTAGEGKLDLPNNRIKAIELLRPFQAETTGAKAFGAAIQQVDPVDVSSIDYGAFPVGWWQVADELNFDSIVSEEVKFDLVCFEYTSWPTDTAQTPTMLAKYENLLFAQTLVGAWTELKDREALAEWQSLRQETLSVVLRSEEEGRLATADLWMRPEQ